MSLFAEYGPWTGEKYRIKEQEPGKYIIQYSMPVKKWIWFGELSAEWYPQGMSLFYMPFYRSVEKAQERIKELEELDNFTPRVVDNG